MAELFVKKYGDLNYENNRGDNLSAVVVPLTGRQRVSKPANRAGGRSIGSLLDSRSITAKGMWVSEEDDPLLARSEWDQFVAAHAPGVPKPLQFDDDRYILAEVASFNPEEWKGLPWRDYSVDFICHNPYFIEYDEQEYVPVFVNGDSSGSFLNTGTAPMPITLELTFAFVPSGGYTSFVFNDVELIFTPPYADTFTFDFEEHTIADTNPSNDDNILLNYISGDFGEGRTGSNTCIFNSNLVTMNISSGSIKYHRRFF